LLAHNPAKELFLGAMGRAFERGCEALLAEHAALAATEAENARVLNSRRGRCRTRMQPPAE
jgi:hypothetical protein